MHRGTTERRRSPRRAIGVGAWWLDGVVALGLAAFAVKEGREAWRGEGCCVGDPLGATDGNDGCTEDCCAHG